MKIDRKVLKVIFAVVHMRCKRPDLIHTNKDNKFEQQINVFEQNLPKCPGTNKTGCGFILLLFGFEIFQSLKDVENSNFINDLSFDV
jgi:hypothetical protein